MNPILSALLVVAAVTVQQPGTNRVAIAPVQTPAAQEIVRIYDVRDILQQLGPDYDAPKLGTIEDATPAEKAKPPKKGDAPAEPTAAEIEARLEASGRVLADLLRKHVQPPLAKNAGELRCVTGGTLVANVTPEQHAWISAFLERLRRFDGCIEVEARFLEGPAGMMEKWGLAPNGVLLDRAALAALDERIKSESGFNLLTTPRLLVLPAQKASLSTLEAVSFVRDWSIETVEPNKQEIAVPQIGVIHEGLALDVRAVPVEDDVFRIDLRVQNCKVKRPIRTARVPLGKDQRMVEIALPEAEVKGQEASLLLASGSSAVVVTSGLDAPGFGAGKDQVLIVSVRRVPRGQR